MTKIQQAAKYAVDNLPMKYVPTLIVRKTSKMDEDEKAFVAKALALDPSNVIAEWYTHINLTVGNTEVDIIGSGASAENAVRMAFGFAFVNYSTRPKVFQVLLKFASNFETGLTLPKVKGDRK